MIMRSIHKRMSNNSLLVLCGIVIVTIVACIILGVHKVVYAFNSK